jgi:hypothetical protein
MFDIKKFGPCKDGFAFAKDKSIENAWATCVNGSWMLWFAEKLDIDVKLLQRAQGKCFAAVKDIQNVTRDEELKMANICRDILTVEVMKKVRVSK